MKSAPKIMALAVVVIVVSIVSGLWALLGTDTGSRWLVTRAVELVPGRVDVMGFQGNLLFGASAERIEYRSTSMAYSVQAAIDELEFEIAFWDLLDGELKVDRLVARKVQVAIVRGESEPSEGGGAEFSLPIDVDVDVEMLAIAAIVVDVDGTEIRLSNARLQAQVSGQNLEVGHAAISSGGFDIELAGTVALRAPFPLDVEIDWRGAFDDVPLGGGGRLRGSLEELAIDHQLRLPEIVSLRGVLIAALEEPRFSGNVEWAGLSRVVEGFGAVEATAGSATLQTDFETYRGEITGGVVVGDLAMARVEATFAGSGAAVDLESLLLKSPAGQVEISGRVDLSEEFEADLVIRVRDLNPAEFNRTLNGRIDVDASFQAESLTDMTLAIHQATGDFLDKAFEARAVVRRQGASVTVDGGSRRIGKHVFRASGRMAPRLAVDFEIDAANLADLWPTLRGSLKGHGTVSGAPDDPAFAIVFDAENVAMDGYGADRVLVDLEGTRDAHELNLEMAGDGVTLTMFGRGAWNGEALQHDLERGLLNIGGDQRWSLEQPAHIRLWDTGVELGTQCWADRDARVCLDAATFTAERAAARLRIDNLPLAGFRHVLDEDLQITGTVDADLDLTRTPGSLSGNLEWRQHDTEIAYEDSDGRTVAMRFEEIVLLGQATGSKAVASLSATSGDGATLRGNVSVTDPSSLDGALTGALEIDVPDIAMLTPLLEQYVDFADPSGRFAIEVAVGGTLRTPEITGKGRIDDASGSVVPLGIDLREINLTLTAKPNGLFDVVGSMRSGDGIIEFVGSASPFDPGGLTARLELDGENFEVVRFAKRRMRVSPDVTARIDGGRIQLGGTVAVPFARIEIETLPETAATSSRDVVIHGVDPSEQDDAEMDILGNMTLVLGNDVRFKGFGLDTGLVGNLKFSQQRDSATRGDGILRLVDGTFSSFGMDLKIDRGTLIFSGPLDNPTLDVRASRTVTYDGRQIVAGLALSGQADAIDTRVFSDPRSSEADALSYLLVGRPATSATTGGEDGDLTNAAISLGLRQALSFTRTAEGIGLEEIGIEGSTDDDRSVVAGVRLSEDVTVRYHYGLFNRVGTILVRYRIARGFSIEAGSGAAQSLDLIYSVDR
ncbi:MAG: translocation/assembly module TamB domain-containing protein [Gammaproteobacteria bacterium]|nr:translocation/assembly module TamB domain-containing protein [Gammaproteobacteria bacterium]